MRIQAKTQVLQDMRLSLEKIDTAALRRHTHAAARMGIDPVVAIRYGLVDGIQALSAAFDNGEIFIPQLLVAAEAVGDSIRILRQQLDRSGEKRPVLSSGTVLVYAVEGDIHDIGKTIVATVLAASGFNVIDLGRNVAAVRVVEAARRQQADVIIGFALMTTTLPVQRDLITCLCEQGLRQQFAVLVGGAVASAEWAEAIGADAYADSLVSTVRLVRRLSARRKLHLAP